MSGLASLRFASFPIPGQVFFLSALSAGIVNLKPLVPGHVLVIPKRVTPRFSDLSTDEVTDLFQSVKTISRAIELNYKAGAMTIACQDGALAGQSVPHIHIHVIPRHPKDFEPLDQVYRELEKVDYSKGYEPPARDAFAVDNEERKARSTEEMVAEAKRLTLLFEKANQVTSNLES